MRWFIYKDQKVYGPYSPEQLTTFIGPETPVTREGHEHWVPARQDPSLRDVLDGKVQPSLEWYVNRRGHQVLGPMTRSALLAMVERGEIETSDLIRHESWTSEVFLGQSRLYALYKDPTLDLDALSPSELRAAPRVRDVAAPAPPMDWRRRLRHASSEIPRGGWWIVAGAVLLLFAYAWHVFTTTGPSAPVPGVVYSDQAPPTASTPPR